MKSVNLSPVMSAENPYLIDKKQAIKIERLGVVLDSDDAQTAKDALVAKLKKEIPDVSDVYSLGQLIDLYDAVFGYYVADHTEVEKHKKKKEETVYTPNRNRNRKKVRIDLTRDLSYATPLLEHLVRFDKLVVTEIKTGLAVKYVNGGYRSNVMNYNELRTVYGKLYGNLYFNMIKTDEQVEEFGLDKNHGWFRSFVVYHKVPIHDVIDCLTSNKVEYLISLNQQANKRKLTNTKNLLSKLQ